MRISGLLLTLLESFLQNRFHKVLLNGQASDWLPVEPRVLQESIVDTLFFLIYINDLSDNLS